MSRISSGTAPGAVSWPASTSTTRSFCSSDSRAASAAPAEPAPTTMIPASAMRGHPPFGGRRHAFAVPRLMESYIEQDRNAMEGSMDVGFIGVGRMGKAMTRNLLKAGHRVRAWDTSRAALDEIAKDGAEIAASARDAFRGDAVMSMLPNDEAMRATFLTGDALPSGGTSHRACELGDRIGRLRPRAGQHPRRAGRALRVGAGLWAARDGGRAQPQHHGGRRCGGDRAGAAAVRRHRQEDLAAGRGAAQRQRRQDRRQPDGRLHPGGDGRGGSAGARLRDAARPTCSIRWSARSSTCRSIGSMPG